MFVPSQDKPASWAKTVAKKFKDTLFGPSGVSPVPEERAGDSSTAAKDEIGLVLSWAKQSQDRLKIYKDIEEMDKDDEMVSTAADVFADAVMNYSLTEDVGIQAVADRRKVQQIIDNCMRRLDLNEVVWNIVREAYLHGNVFREVRLGKKKNYIAELCPSESPSIWPNMDENGQRIPGWIVVKDNVNHKVLEEWQILPLIFGARKGTLAYPPLATARRNWQRLQKMEDSAAVARITRAYDKYVHKVPVGNKWTKDQVLSALHGYREAITKKESVILGETNTKKTKNQFDVETDFYLPDDGSGRGDINVLASSNSQLMNFNDIYYSRERLLARLRVPINLLQILSSQKTHMTSGSGLAGADVQFVRVVKRMQEQVKDMLIRLFTIECVLQGVVPKDGEIRITMSNVDNKNLNEEADAVLTFAQASVYFLEAFGAIPPDLMADMFFQLDEKQKAMFKEFLNTDAKKVMDARIKTIEANAELAKKNSQEDKENPQASMPSSKKVSSRIKDRVPNSGDEGSGNQNKSKTARSKEQMPSQSVPLDDVENLFLAVAENVHDMQVSQGVSLPDFDEESVRNEIRSNLLRLVGTN